MNDNLKRIGKILKIERIKNDLSQEKLAEKIGVSARTISLIESGFQHPRFLLVAKLFYLTSDCTILPVKYLFATLTISEAVTSSIILI